MKHDQTYINHLLDQYRSGKISTKDRHELERIALDDPFLFDAMEAYAASNPLEDQRSIDQLKQKVSRPSGRIVSMRNLSIAAGLVILIGGMVWLQGNLNNPTDGVVSQRTESDIELTDKAASETIQDDAADFIDVKPGDVGSNVPLNTEPESNVLHAPTTATRSQPSSNSAKLNDANAPDLTESKKESEEVPTAVNDNVEYAYEFSESSVSSEADAVKEVVTKVEGDTFGSEEIDNAATNEERLNSSRTLQAVGELNKRSKQKMAQSTLLSGKVTDVTGEPLIGAKVALGNALIATDIDGSFKLIQTEPDQKLRVSYVGYNDFEKVLPDSSLTDVAVVLEEEDAVLDEVVIVGTGADENMRSNDQPYVIPPEGRTAFKQFVKEQALKQGCGEKGKVKLKFVVDIYGEPHDFEIKKGLSSACDAAAIEIIKNGGRWDNQFLKVKTVRYTVTFD